MRGRKTMLDGPSATRRKILHAATLLFSSVGIRATTINDIIASAGVSRRTLYYHFRSKDDLIHEALTVEQASAQSVAALLREASARSAEEGVRLLFSTIRQMARDQRWKGCSYMRAVVEFAGLPGHPAIVAAKQHRKAIERAFAESLRLAHVREPDRKAVRLLVLFEGAVAQSLLYHAPIYAEEAEAMALELLSEQPGEPEYAPHHKVLISA